MNRRDFISGSSLGWAVPFLAASLADAESANSREGDEGKIWTVTGAVRPESIGWILPHEHVFSRFGAESTLRPEYDEPRVMATAAPYLRYLRELGCGAVVDCTTAYFGRHPRLLQRLSKASRLPLVTNTGYYGAANDKYVPPHAFQESADQLAGRWLKEWQEGIEGTGIRPGFIKTGVDGGALSEIDRKLIVAACRTHLKSGLTIAVHTGDNPESIRQQLSILREEGVSPAAWIWVHANAAKNSGELIRAAEGGAWIGLDGLRTESYERHLELVKEFKQRNLLGRVLLSHDGNYYPAPGRIPRDFHLLFTSFVYSLREAGLSEGEVRQLLADNPRQALTVRIRPR